jgi:hypothetical protein|tara:strand:+ start:998 stop:1474 length:477 start_codon:yes stop_codon:yes gene_type:complete
MKKTLTIIAVVAFAILVLRNIIAAVYYVIIPTTRDVMNIDYLVFESFYYAAGLCLSIAVLLPDKKPQLASTDISQLAQNITAMKKRLAIIASAGCGLSLLYHLLLHLFFYGGSFHSVVMNFGSFFTLQMITPIAGLCLSVAVISPYKEPKVAIADLRQ